MRYKFFEWVDPRLGKGEFTSHYQKLGGKGMAKCDERLRYLRDQPPSMWVDPNAKKLSDNTDKHCKNIYEIRIKANNVQQRPLGYFGPESDCFTIVLWATHKGDDWIPGNFCEVAERRWDEVNSGVAQTNEIEID